MDEQRTEKAVKKSIQQSSLEPTVLGQETKMYAKGSGCESVWLLTTLTLEENQARKREVRVPNQEEKINLKQEDDKL